MPDARRIGLQGGSFNPVHFGHLRAAEEVRERLGLAEVWLVLAANPPHKRRGDVADAADRLRMLELALRSAPGLRIETCEIARSGPSYTIDTIHALGAAHPGCEFCLILGADAFREIDSWHRWEDLVASCDLVVTSRPPDAVASGPDALAAIGAPIAVRRAFWYDEKREWFRHPSGRRLEFVPVTALDISASQLRDLVRAGRSIRFLTDPEVVAYIAERGLYRTAMEDPIPRDGN
ncbi:MAG TPA: nicotinate-nucleotide adenylyltransferase [Candidatus Binatia bacterium]|nr:nicotinate-nucleotide adenylyltransferase [Candidatus Binatia bacterium]